MMRETSDTSQFHDFDLRYANPNSANCAWMVDVVLPKKMYCPEKPSVQSKRNTI
jgi:hypothetical protein